MVVVRKEGDGVTAFGRVLPLKAGVETVASVAEQGSGSSGADNDLCSG